jgi:hypothetical protein
MSPNKKQAPAKKPVAKPVKTASKPVAKPTAKPVVKLDSKHIAKTVKPTPKPVAKVVAAPVAKAASKPVAKVAVKPVAKPVSKPVAKLAEKVAEKATPPKAAKVVKKEVTKLLPKNTVKIVPKVASKTPSKKTPKEESKPVPEAKVEVHVIPKVESKPAKEKEKDKEAVDVSILLKTHKLLRTSFFFEVIEAEERNNKKKYSADMKLPEKPTICVRNRSSLVEETPEELIERLAQELEEENFGMMREFGSQMCTKCGVQVVSMEFRVDKDLGYCEECADILRLGQSKEARKSDYQMSLKKRDPLAADADEPDAEGGTVDDDELEELEDD